MPAIFQPRLLGPDRAQSVLITRGASDRAGGYDPFGYRVHPIGGIAFNGQLPEASTGNYLLGHGHRSYSPVLRCFLSPDALSPFGAGGVNAYAYCHGDPVNTTDPTGQVSVRSAALVFGGGMAAGIALVVGGFELNARRGQHLVETEDGSYFTDNTMNVVGGMLIALGGILIVGSAAVAFKMAKKSRKISATSNVAQAFDGNSSSPGLGRRDSGLSQPMGRVDDHTPVSAQEGLAELERTVLSFLLEARVLGLHRNMHNYRNVGNLFSHPPLITSRLSAIRSNV